MAACSLSTVKPLLEPHEAEIVGIVLEAWKQWWESDLRRRCDYGRCSATVVHNLITTLVRERWSGRTKEFHLIERDETLFIVVGVQVMLRFKKGNEDGLSRNAPTAQSSLFTDPTEALPVLNLGLPDVARIDVAYVLNKLQTEVAAVKIVARKGDAVLWSYDLPMPISGSRAAAAPVAPMPSGPTLASAADEVIRLPSRNAPKKDQESA